MDTISEELNEALRRIWHEHGPRMPRYRYFQYKHWQYCWTTERMADDRFAAFVYKPLRANGRLATKAEDIHMWKVVKELHFNQRQTAKARAMQWVQAAKAKDEK